MKITIRTGTPSDFDAVQRMNAALFKFEDPLNGGARNVDWPFSEAGIKYFKKCLNQEDNCITFIAEVGGEPAGYLNAAVFNKPYMTGNPVAEIENMFVEEPFRNHGVGAKLMAAFKSWAAEHHVGRLTVGAVAGNDAALEFYRHHGFIDTIINLEQPFS